MTYTYDDGGRRVKVAIGTNLTNYIWDELSPYGDVIQETDGQDVQTAAYILGGTELISQTRGGSTQFYLQDGQMSVRALTNGLGGVVNRYTYDAYGTTRVASGNAANVYQYTGQQLDSATGLYSLRARWYDLAQGRFNSRDPEQYKIGDYLEVNCYGYASENIINYYDPKGRNTLFERLGIENGSIKAIGQTALGRFKLGFFAGAVAGIGGYFLGLAIVSIIQSIAEHQTKGGNILALFQKYARMNFSWIDLVLSMFFGGMVGGFFGVFNGFNLGTQALESALDAGDASLAILTLPVVFAEIYSELGTRFGVPALLYGVSDAASQIFNARERNQKIDISLDHVKTVAAWSMLNALPGFINPSAVFWNIFHSTMVNTIISLGVSVSTSPS